MPYDPRIHHRRSIRLQDYDYSEEGAYFVTICAQDQRLLFGDVRDEAMHPNDAGHMIQQIWDGLPQHYPGVDTDVFQLMPNHLHGIIVLYVDDVPTRREGRVPIHDATDRLGRARDETCEMSLSDVVQRFKSLTTTRYRQGVLRCGWPCFRSRVWQRNYHEHVIRDERDLDRIRQYIIGNPSDWQFDRENPDGRRRPPDEPWQV